MRKKVRTLRHWKQRFDKNAEFIWRRPITWQGKLVTAGDPIPKDLQENKTKLRRFWEARVIELAQFEEPDVLTGQKPEPTPEPTFDYAAEWPDTPENEEIRGLAMEEAGLDQEAWDALSDLERADLMQSTMGETLEPDEEDEDDETEETVDETPSIADKEPADLVTKETDRKWHVQGVEEVFKSKTLATAKAAEMIAEAKAAEAAEDDAWLDGDNQED